MNSQGYDGFVVTGEPARGVTSHCQWQSIVIILAWVTALAVLLMMSAPRAHADQCQDDPAAPYGVTCVAQVNFAQFAQTAYQTQQADEWCWAASISMIWDFHGFNVSQSQIVSSVYGGVIDLPAMSTQQLLGVLNRQYTDDAGRPFRSSVSGLYDASSGVDTISYASLGAALGANQPIMIGVQNLDGSGHAVVLTAIEYYQEPGVPGVDPSGVNIIGAGVFDPWPGNGARPLTLPQDLTPVPQGGNLEFAATIDVSAIQAPTTTLGSSDASSGGGKGALDYPLLCVGALLIACRQLRTLGRRPGEASR